MTAAQRPVASSRQQPASHQSHPTSNGHAPAQQHAAPEHPDGKAVLAAILEGKAAEYTPLAEKKPITLTINLVKQYLVVPTKSGKYPTDQDCVRYIMMCMQRGLNPWAQDCWLLGYDTKHGPKFSLVVAIQALLKRAELSRTIDGMPAFDGMDSGIVAEALVYDQDESGGFVERKTIIERQGDLLEPGDKLIGGWAKIYRKDRSRYFYQRLKLETYRKDTPMWDQDAAGMIVKNAESAGLRQAFPSDIGGLYLASEIEAFADDAAAKTRTQQTGAGGAVNLDVLSGRAPGQSPAPDTLGDEGTQDQPPDEPSTQVGEQAEQAEQGDEHDTEESGTGPVSSEEEFTNWQYDIEQASTNGALDKLAEDCVRDCTGPIRNRVMETISKRRTALAGGHIHTQSASKKSGKQNPLPGT